jgi:hypothetical protein
MMKRERLRIAPKFRADAQNKKQDFAGKGCQHKKRTPPVWKNP